MGVLAMATIAASRVVTATYYLVSRPCQ
jgi:hypothetical protein